MYQRREITIEEFLEQVRVGRFDHKRQDLKKNTVNILGILKAQFEFIKRLSKQKSQVGIAPCPAFLIYVLTSLSYHKVVIYS